MLTTSESCAKIKRCTLKRCPMKKIVLFLLTAASLAAAPQAVVFDFGGVLANPQRQPVLNFLCDSLQITEKEFAHVKSERIAAMKAGKSEVEFYRQFAKEKGIDLPADWEQSFYATIKETFCLNEEMYGLVNQLKEKQIPVALLSNIDERLAAFIRKFGWYKPFDPCLLSCEIGVEKPDVKAYKILLEKLSLPPADIVFIDDLPDNVAAAKKTGIDAIVFKSTEQVRKELTKRGLL